MPRYDNFDRPMAANDFKDKLNGAFAKTQGVGHNHKQKATGAMDEGNGGPIELEGIDPTLAGGANEGTLWQIISWIVKKIKELTKKTNWWDAGGADADKLSGKTAGNANGNIPVSNGLKCVNLNAQIWDGFRYIKRISNVVTIGANTYIDIELEQSETYHYLIRVIATTQIHVYSGYLPNQSYFVLGYGNSPSSPDPPEPPYYTRDTLRIYNHGAQKDYFYEVLVIQKT